MPAQQPAPERPALDRALWAGIARVMARCTVKDRQEKGHEMLDRRPVITLSWTSQADYDGNQLLPLSGYESGMSTAEVLDRISRHLAGNCRRAATAEGLDASGAPSTWTTAATVNFGPRREWLRMD